MQILEFLGDVSLASQKSQRLTQRRRTSLASDKLTGSGSPRSNAEESGWNASRIYEVAKKICWEISHSIHPYSLHHWVAANHTKPSKMSALFTFSAW